MARHTLLLALLVLALSAAAAPQAAGAFSAAPDRAAGGEAALDAATVPSLAAVRTAEARSVVPAERLAAGGGAWAAARAGAHVRDSGLPLRSARPAEWTDPVPRFRAHRALRL